MVDYAITIYSEPMPNKAILDKLRSKHSESINHTKAEYIRFKPIAISIETKRPAAGEGDAKIQLGVWSSAHFQYLVQFCSSQNLPILPQILVVGHVWLLKIASWTGSGEIVCTCVPIFLLKANISRSCMVIYP